MKSFFDIGPEEECICCSLQKEVMAELKRRNSLPEDDPEHSNFLLPVASFKNIKMCNDHESEFNGIQERLGPEITHPWEYIAGYANSCNY